VIAMPDFFRGKGWDTTNVPPKEGRPAMQAYIQSVGAWEIIKPDLAATVEWLKGEGRDDIGVCFEDSLLYFMRSREGGLG
jgi:hypothetical protein